MTEYYENPGRLDSLGETILCGLALFGFIVLARWLPSAMGLGEMMVIVLYGVVLVFVVLFALCAYNFGLILWSYHSSSTRDGTPRVVPVRIITHPRGHGPTPLERRIVAAYAVEVIDEDRPPRKPLPPLPILTLQKPERHTQ